MAAAAGDAMGRKSAFRRGLNATRLAVASAVTVLIVIVVAYAIVVVTRTEELTLTVTGGIIYVKPDLEAVQPREVRLSFSVQANNPSGRARFYYTGLEGFIYLVNNRTSTSMFKFGEGLKDMVVAPNSMLQTVAVVSGRDFKRITPYFDELYYGRNNDSIFTNAKLTLNGTLTVGLYSAYNKTGGQKVYYCFPLTMGTAGNASAPDMDDNVLCDPDLDPTQ